MNIVLLILFVVFSSGMKFAGADQFFPDYCSAKKSNAIKGIFVMIVFLAHGKAYFPLGEGDLWIDSISTYLKQLGVAPFLFYSGFGVMESIQKKGLVYIKSIPLNRVCKTVVYADIAVLCFALFYLIMGFPLTVKHLLLSLVFWEEIGNSCWYFFVIVCLYGITYLSFRIFHKNHFLGASITTALSMFLFIFLITYKDLIWYNTFFIYHFGMWYSLLRRKIEPVVMKNDLIYFSSILFAFLGYLWFSRLGSFYFFIITGCMMMTLIIGVSMKVSIDNPVLQFLGNHILGYYALQRIPMILLAKSEMNAVCNYIVCWLATTVLVLIYDRIIVFVDRRLFCRIKSAS